MENQPEAIRFIKDRKWPGTNSCILDIPSDRLATVAVGDWSTLNDSQFSGNVLPKSLQANYFKLLKQDDDPPQTAWDAFMDDLWNVIDGMGLTELAEWLVNMNDPNTIRTVLYLRDGIEYVDEECTTPWKQDR